MATPTIPTCFKTAWAVHSLPGKTAFHIDACQSHFVTLQLSKDIKSYAGCHPFDIRQVSWEKSEYL